MSIDNTKIEVLENLTVNYEDMAISITGRANGILDARTNDEILLFASDVLRQSTGETSFENEIEEMIALRETLVSDFGWTDLQVHDLIRKLRKNLYLLKVGEDHRQDGELKEYKELIKSFEEKEIEKFRPVTDGEISLEEVKEEPEKKVKNKKKDVDKQ
jgi:hypothetical protein